MAKTKDTEKLIIVSAAVPVLICKANRPLNEQQHEELVRKLEAEQARTGLKVLLVPNSADVAVGAEIQEQEQEGEGNANGQSGAPGL
ncbi:hypothetical protein [Cohnella herbarum]|uniref:hypothetical protein n=1 Tax=Cohnella herbarum TaxID=2728023 RepID=UPI0015823800|nr:hypothetical protein [Cohnella herbarum]